MPPLAIFLCDILSSDDFYLNGDKSTRPDVSVGADSTTSITTIEGHHAEQDREAE
jgi:hypothetical protein